MVLPSGDHAGFLSSAGSSLSRSMVPVPISYGQEIRTD
jgi:hypothetical protein